ncbi:flagellar basal-body rod protein FlgF [Devosia sp.]|uniref:flagellar basal-body rod protein FlgF n=1 Tax=Devosia sp. TaxID=1871048 RepID=UPI0032655F20
MIENAQLISLSRQMALQRQMDVVANNMANVNTTGFKSEQMLFEQYDMPVARDRDFQGSDQPLAYVQDWATVHDLSGGDIIQTGNPLDVALNGDGFFSVQTSGGERYTKSGAFQISNTGQLVDLNGNPVLGQGGPFQFGPAEKDVAIAADGTVSTSAGIKGRLKLVEFAQPQALNREGDNLFSGGTPTPSTKTQAMQGSLEKSNVSGITQMAEMIRVTRSYESIAQLMSRQDEMRSAAIQRLGSVNA